MLSKLYDNEPLGADPHLVVPLECYHSNHENPDCRAYKLLGIYLEESLNFNHHTNFLCNKLNRSLFCMRRAKNLLSQAALKTLYFAFIQSHLTTVQLFSAAYLSKTLIK